MKESVAVDRRRRRTCVALFFLGAFVATAAVVATLLVAHAPPPSRPADLTLIYVGAEDCTPCRVWQRGEGAAFRRSADFARLTYFEVKSPHLRDVLNDENWPQAIRGYRDRLRRNDGVPLWLIVSNDGVVEQRFGAAAWRDNILPAIRTHLR